MELDADTVLTAVYCLVDDLYRAEFAAAKPRRPGPAPRLADSEVLALMVLAQWQPSERGFVRYAARHWREYFPALLSQSRFNRRARDLWGVLCALGPLVARRLADELGGGAYEALDGLPVPLMRRCRGDRHRVFADEADVGRGGSDRDWYYGVKLIAAVDPNGCVSGFVLTPAATEEHWGAEALHRWRADPAAGQPTAEELAPVLGPAHRHHGRRLGPTGPIGPRAGVGRRSGVPVVTDGGLRGRRWRAHWASAWGAAVLSTADVPWAPVMRPLASLRQGVETAFSALTGTFGLAFPRARSRWGLWARVGAKVAALNFTRWLNHLLDRPLLALPNPFA
jgi:hypothetical protein